MKIEKGLCQCGCGQKTIVSTINRTDRGWIAGEPRNFLKNHQNRKRNVPIEGYIVDTITNCWIWQLTLNNKGYGRITYKGKVTYAHIHHWEKINGPVPEGLELDHTCKTRACVNPDHLEPITHGENLRRSKRTKLSLEMAEEIHKLNAQGIGYRRLAKMFGVHRSTICHLITKRNRKDVETNTARIT